jgi:AraC-like DNA-binding protein
MLEPGPIRYTPREGLCAQAGLNIRCGSLTPFEYCWNWSGDYGDFRITKTGIRSGFDICVTDCLVRQDIRFSVDDHPSVFCFSFGLSGESCSRYGIQRQSIEISAGKQGVFYCPDPNGTGRLGADMSYRHVGIIISPERLLSYFESDLGSIHPDLCSILEKDRDRPFCHIRTITPAMRVALQQLLNCPFSGVTRKLFLESRAMELIAYQLQQMSDTRQLPATGDQYLHPRDRKRTELARDILLSNLETPPGLGRLARDAGMSPPKLNRCFRKVYGMTVFEYLRNERLNRAREMLGHGFNVTEAAYAVGYESISHFSQAFKKQFGTSPSSCLGRS